MPGFIKRATLLLLMASPFIFAIFLGCSATSVTIAVPGVHPEELDPIPPICTDCHDAEEGERNFNDFAHRADWTGTHRLIASRETPVCEMCHSQSFCMECHQSGTELKPSLRNQPATYRAMPHRGDYISRHRIDGRVNPAPCFSCHGNPNSAATCARCHK